MGKIRKLDEALANKIAAGEVVENPRSIVKELLENAIDANSKSVTIEIKDGGLSYIRVTDDGCGIEEEQKKLIFTPFYTTNKQLGGSGLGLSIVYNLVTQKLDGKIEVDSEKGHGIKFTIIIPLQEDSMHG